MADNTDSRWAVKGWSNMLTFAYLAFHITAMIQLPREVNKFLLAYVILFKRINFCGYTAIVAQKIGKQ